jgi:hypothetical protein
MGDVRRQEASEMPLAEDEHVVDALSPDAAEEALAHGVGARSPDRCANHLDCVGRRDAGEGGSVCGIVVVDREPGSDVLGRCLGV